MARRFAGLLPALVGTRRVALQSRRLVPLVRRAAPALVPLGAAAWATSGAGPVAAVALLEEAQAPEERSLEDLVADIQRKAPADDTLDVVLYQYQNCPFCSKVRTFLDLHNIRYRMVEVEPLRKPQLKFSVYRKVPVCVINGVQVNDSVRIIETIARLQGVNLEQSSPEVAAKVNQWTEWSNEWLVRVLTSNIYINWGQAMESFEYLLEPSYGFSTMQQTLARYVGASVMLLVSRFKLNSKYGITAPREQLYESIDAFIKELGEDDFLSGTHWPSIADVSAFGYMRATQGTQTHRDLMANTSVSAWYQRMEAAVGQCKGRKVLADSIANREE